MWKLGDIMPPVCCRILKYLAIQCVTRYIFRLEPFSWNSLKAAQRPPNRGRLPVVHVHEGSAPAAKAAGGNCASGICLNVYTQSELPGHCDKRHVRCSCCPPAHTAM